MKWYNKNYPETGTERVIKRFLFFPKRLLHEHQWLCMAKIKQEYERTGDGDRWIDKEFVNN